MKLSDKQIAYLLRVARARREEPKGSIAIGKSRFGSLGEVVRRYAK